MPSVCIGKTRKSYGGAKTAAQIAEKLLRKKANAGNKSWKNFYAKKNTNAGFKNMVGMANGLAAQSVNNAAAAAAAQRAANEARAAALKATQNPTIQVINNANKKAQNMAKLANNAAKVAANAAKIANSLKAKVSALGGSRRRSRRNRKN